MVESANLAFVKRFYAALEDGDVEAVTQMCAPNVEWIYPNVKEIPYCREWRGPEGVVNFLSRHDEAEEILDFRQTDFVARGDLVVVRGAFRGRAKLTGRVWDTAFVHVATVSHGRLQRFEACFDTAAAVEARR